MHRTRPDGTHAPHALQCDGNGRRATSARRLAHPCHICTGTALALSHICTETRHARATSAPGLGRRAHHPKSFARRLGARNRQAAVVLRRQVGPSRLKPARPSAARSSRLLPTCHALCFALQSASASACALREVRPAVQSAYTPVGVHSLQARRARTVIRRPTALAVPA